MVGLNAKGILDLRRLHQHSTDLELVIAAIECLKDDSSDESDDSDASDEELLQMCAIVEHISVELLIILKEEKRPLV